MIAHYRTRQGAERCAKALRVKFPGYTFEAHEYGFGFGISVTTPEGRKAWADKRPRNFDAQQRKGTGA